MTNDLQFWVPESGSFNPWMKKISLATCFIPIVAKPIKFRHTPMLQWLGLFSVAIRHITKPSQSDLSLELWKRIRTEIQPLPELNNSFACKEIPLHISFILGSGDHQSCNPKIQHCASALSIIWWCSITQGI